MDVCDSLAVHRNNGLLQRVIIVNVSVLLYLLYFLPSTTLAGSILTETTIL